MGWWVRSVLLLAVSLAGAGVAIAQDARATKPEARAVAFLAREVPRWRAEHPCYSCHNNGDAARALITAARRGHALGAALDDTLAWLRQPVKWNDKMPQGGIDDKPLARIQFASALRLAVSAGHADRSQLIEAAGFVAADQRADGAWQLDSSQSLGSPTTYGTVLATSSALRVLRSAERPSFAEAIAKGDAWLRQLTIETVLDAAAVLIGSARADAMAQSQRDPRSQSSGRVSRPPAAGDSNVTSPSQVFDTALVMLALAEFDTDREAIARAREI